MMKMEKKMMKKKRTRVAVVATAPAAQPKSRSKRAWCTAITAKTGKRMAD
jgi:hypothetical protein